MINSALRSQWSRSTAGLLALLLLVWLSVIPFHVQHETGFRAPDGTFVSAEVAAHLDCLPFPLTPNSPETDECQALQTWNAGVATLSLPLPPLLSALLLEVAVIVPAYRSPFVVKAWLRLASLRAPPAR